MPENVTIEGLTGKIKSLGKEYKTIRAEKQKYFTADPNKRWTYSEFKEEGAQVVVDKNALQPDELDYFTRYEKIADKYIAQRLKVYANDTSKHAPSFKMTGKMLADSALKTYIKYGKDIKKVVPIELALAQLEVECHLGTSTKRKANEKSPFNVGVFNKGDANFLDKVKDAEEGTELYYDVMAEDYFSNKSAEQFMQSAPANEVGSYYAITNDGKLHPDYDPRNPKGALGSYIRNIRDFAKASGIRMPNAAALEDNKVTDDDKDKPTPTPKPVPKNDNTTPTPQPSATLKSTVGVGGENLPEDVKIVKTLLNKFGYKLTPDNPNWGDSSTAALKDFQTKHVGIQAPKGLINSASKTWAALNASPSKPKTTPATTPTKESTPAPVAPTTLKSTVGAGGENSPNDVKIVKTLLNKYGYKLNVAAPAWSDADTAALKSFQSKYVGLPSPKGLINNATTTWKVLSSSTLAKPKETTPNKDKDGTNQAPTGKKPSWLTIAEGEDGTGFANNPDRVMEYFDSVSYHEFLYGKGDKAKKARENKEMFEWCGVFVGWCLAKAGLKNCGGMGAAAETWVGYGVKLTKPALGCIAVVDGGKHVAFVHDYNPKTGIVTLLGGNQGKSKLTSTVNAKYPINKDRLTFVAPSGYEDKLHVWD